MLGDGFLKKGKTCLNKLYSKIPSDMIVINCPSFSLHNCAVF